MGKDGISNNKLFANTEVREDFTILVHTAQSIFPHDGFPISIIAANFSIKVSYDEGHISPWSSIVNRLQLVVKSLFVLIFCLVGRGIDLYK